MWFSSTSLSDEILDSMLIRILTVRELHLETEKTPTETDSDSDTEFRPWRWTETHAISAHQNCRVSLGNVSPRWLCNSTKLTKPECHWIGLRILIVIPRTGKQVFCHCIFHVIVVTRLYRFFFFFWLYGLHLEDNAEFYTVPHYTQVIFKGIIAHSLYYETLITLTASLYNRH